MTYIQHRPQFLTTWAKDILAGAFLVVFFVAAFFFSSGAERLLDAMP